VFFAGTADSSEKMFSFSVGCSGLSTYIQEVYIVRLNFNDEDIKILQCERYYYPDPKAQRRMEIVLLKAHGLPHHQIQNISGARGSTITLIWRFQGRGAHNPAGIKPAPTAGRPTPWVVTAFIPVSREHGGQTKPSRSIAKLRSSFPGF
jgi:hypothetical protein